MAHRILLIAVVFAGLVQLAVGEGPTRVVATLVDGKTTAGELVESTPAGVTIRPNAKADAVVVAWSKIARLSNGLTHEQVVARWRRDQADQLCETCKGAGRLDCETCHGTHVDPAQAKSCETCAGKGTTGPCKSANCVGGQIPCPDPCLKAASFSGQPDADGKRWRQFRGKSGTLRISDAHVGELVITEKGDPAMKGKCSRCDGTTRVPDPACRGSGLTTCKPCNGKCVTGPACAVCSDGAVNCTPCAASGLKKQK